MWLQNRWQCYWFRSFLILPVVIYYFQFWFRHVELNEAEKRKDWLETSVVHIWILYVENHGKGWISYCGSLPLIPPCPPSFPRLLSLLLINPYSCLEVGIFYSPLYCSKTVVIKILESWKLNRGVLNLKHQMWKASTAIYITFQNRQKKLMSYSTNTVHDVSFQSLNHQNLMLFIFPCLIVLLECTFFWKISASSTLCSLVGKKNIYLSFLPPRFCSF